MYEGGTTLDGTGASVAVVDAYNSPTIRYDSTHYASENGDRGYAPGQYVSTTPASFRFKTACGYTGWYGEQTLDVEAVHAMAGGARIHYYGAKSCADDDFTDTIQQVVDDNDVQIVSNSYGEPEDALTTDGIAANEAVYLQGAAEGISFLFSSGDNGDELAKTGLKQADADASDPYVTAVGGTATGIGPSGELEFQTGWGTGLAPLSKDGKSWDPTVFQSGAGGGVSRLFNQPSYQRGVYNSAYRTVPDVAMDANPATGCTPAVTLAANQHNPDIDAGLIATQLAALGDYVWFDRNSDGVQNEPLTDGANGVTVRLYIDDGDGNPEPGTGDTLVGTTVTADDVYGRPGYYLFDGLIPGLRYFVQFVRPASATGGS